MSRNSLSNYEHDDTPETLRYISMFNLMCLSSVCDYLGFNDIGLEGLVSRSTKPLHKYIRYENVGMIYLSCRYPSLSEMISY